MIRNPRACERCRSRKVRCDGDDPCSACHQRNQPCIYRPEQPPRSRREKRRRAEVIPSNYSTGPSDAPPTATPTRRARISLNPAQFKRHRELRAGIGVSNVDTGFFQFYGPSSHFCFIQRMCQRITRSTNETLLTPSASVPDGVGKWNLERFMFRVDRGCKDSKYPDAYISQELGNVFIDSYFEIMHPQVPVLDHSEIIEQWGSLWKPPTQQNTDKGNEILFMVLAIGARVAIAEGELDASQLEGWASHFACLASKTCPTLEDPSLCSTQLLLLKAMYAYQVMRPNDAYLYFGQAARGAMVLGLNRFQVMDGSNTTVHALKRTFWTVYAYERMNALFSGRPSTFRDEMIDGPYPDDLPIQGSVESNNYNDPIRLSGFIRALAGIGRVADQVFLKIYSPASISNPMQLVSPPAITADIDETLSALTHNLPVYLHFFDESLPIGHGWQEVQRLTLGAYYYLTQMLTHRPALLYSAFFQSRDEAQKQAGESIEIDHSINETLSAAKHIIDLTHDVYFRRYSRARFEGSSATVMVAAAVTLLYDVLDPATTTDHAREVFAAVERAVECLDLMPHVGPTSGKAVSLDVMRIAKEALWSNTAMAAEDSGLGQDLAEDFPWLQYVYLLALAVLRLLCDLRH